MDLARHVENLYMTELREFVTNHPELPQDYINNCFVGKLKFPDESEVTDIQTGAFKTIKKLGDGAFSKVTKIEHIKTNKIMARKVQKIEFQPGAIDKEDRNKCYLYLVRETIVLKRSNSPYIPEFYGMHFSENYIVYYMEALDLDAEMLYKKVKEQNGDNKTMFDGQALSIIAASVTNALAYLKKNLDVMHRDIKPPNILLDFKGNVKLGDLGLVVFLEQSNANSIGSGSPAYLAPEIFKNGGITTVMRTLHNYNVKSDVWSLGITLIEIARFENPYAHINSIHLQNEILNKDAPRLNDGDGGYSDMLITFINQCLNKNENINQCLNKNETERPHIRDLKETELVNNFSNLSETQSYMHKFLSQYYNKNNEHEISFIIGK